MHIHPHPIVQPASFTPAINFDKVNTRFESYTLSHDLVTTAKTALFCNTSLTPHNPPNPSLASSPGDFSYYRSCLRAKFNHLFPDPTNRLGTRAFFVGEQGGKRIVFQVNIESEENAKATLKQFYEIPEPSSPRPSPLNPTKAFYVDDMSLCTTVEGLLVISDGEGRLIIASVPDDDNKETVMLFEDYVLGGREFVLEDVRSREDGAVLQAVVSYFEEEGDQDASPSSTHSLSFVHASASSGGGRVGEEATGKDDEQSVRTMQLPHSKAHAATTQHIALITLQREDGDSNSGDAPRPYTYGSTDAFMPGKGTVLSNTNVTALLRSKHPAHVIRFEPQGDGLIVISDGSLALERGVQQPQSSSIAPAPAHEQLPGGEVPLAQLQMPAMKDASVVEEECIRMTSDKEDTEFAGLRAEGRTDEAEEEEDEDGSTGQLTFVHRYCAPAEFRGAPLLLTQVLSLGIHQWLGVGGPATPPSLPSIVVKSDVDAIVFDLKPAQLTCDKRDEVMMLEHTSTFAAFGYVQAGKRHKKFMTFAADHLFAAIAEYQRIVYVYERPGGSSTSAQQIIDLSPDEEIEGMLALPGRKLLLLTNLAVYVAIVNQSTTTPHSRKRSFSNL
mmetsp:Transcript_1002/g.1762  ORF Transcript_1002/g.1762 Transcript_1002/m.1762 type:complete len:614 (-) Transcript_1002:83-1924(-)|eukprot:CAMPEP_0184649224 /NCGR_PEP_ID=MMETSP0308-20130426/6525_1 /TAXON_ID=38269 /ORGANISM="Gloeochaete witrockiana, Strain SAG 46.84" /LENGTH=613 /DNA_ID=CAMNT_0027081749 /DNA_START=101 /DNA_END=1942 /DNA_ORIENTATION=-